MFLNRISEDFKYYYDPMKELNGISVAKSDQDIYDEVYKELYKGLSICEFSTRTLKGVYNTLQNNPDIEPMEYPFEEETKENAKKKEELSERARKFYLSMAVKHCVTGKYSERFYSIANRPAANLIMPDLEHMTFKEIQNYYENFDQITPVERLAYFRKNLDAMYDLVQKLSTVTTDEELLNVSEGKSHLFFMIGELEDPKDTGKMLTEKLGIPLEEKDFEKWREISGCSVDLTTYGNRIGEISSPYYSRYKNFDAFGAFVQEVGNADLGDAPEEIRAAIEYSAGADTQAYKERTGHFGSTLKHLGLCYGFSIPQMSMKFSSVLPMRMNKISDNPRYCTVTGKELNPSEAGMELAGKKYVDLFDGTKFVARVKKNPGGYVSTSEAPLEVDFTKARKQDVKNLLESLKEYLGEGDSEKYTDVVDTIDSISKDLTTQVKIEKDFKALAGKMDAYFAERSIDGKATTDMTTHCDNAMLKAYNVIRPIAEQNAKLLDKTDKLLDSLTKAQLEVDLGEEKQEISSFLLESSGESSETVEETYKDDTEEKLKVSIADTPELKQ